MNLEEKTFFTEKLFEWFSTNYRPMPWKGEKNPYLIWLSEIILQQTTVNQGLPYFQRFANRYPSVKDLAEAPEDEVMKMWEGLGYYSRVRNLHATAQYISTQLNGLFPNSYEALLTLKGVGTYTAAAIASFAFDLPFAVVDGNVYRVLSRFFGIDLPIDAPQAKRFFTDLANDLLDDNRAADFNQAMMDFGATHCTPAKPNCKNCLMNSQCVAFQQNRVHELPIKSKKTEKKTRYFNYLIINKGEFTFIKKRLEKDIWQNLYEFPLVETDFLAEKLNVLIENPTNSVEESMKDLLINAPYKFIKKSPPLVQMLTHRKIIAQFWEIEMPDNFYINNVNYLKVERKNLFKFAFPKVIDSYLNTTELTLF